jgi:hypothetical protein
MVGFREEGRHDFLLPLREKVGGGAARMRGRYRFAGFLKASVRLAYPSSGPPGHLLPQGEKEEGVAPSA